MNLYETANRQLLILSFAIKHAHKNSGEIIEESELTWNPKCVTGKHSTLTCEVNSKSKVIIFQIWKAPKLNPTARLPNCGMYCNTVTRMWSLLAFMRTVPSGLRNMY